ncbi:FCP1 homology domain [Trypanosoma melophagium]|uniref:FCP1 homology domain n=1 Tax=Trypanosoma melophagium TaxID=715481 RepID=UPI00351A0681|nr:FCP1 homology domain [Trypanosoma melophagium]
MSQDATSFFRGISAKISAAKQSYNNKMRRVKEEGEEEPQQPVSSSLLPSSSTAKTVAASSSAATHFYMSSSSGVLGMHGTLGAGSSNNSLSLQSEQVTGMLMTQARQTRVPVHRDPMAGPEDNARYVNSKDSGREQNRALGKCSNNATDNYNTNTTTTTTTNNNNNNNSNSAGNTMKPKVHLSCLVERTRKIQGLPKNTSPVNAKNHASLLSTQMPRYRGKKTLVLDVDETLVHSSLSCQPKRYDLVLNVKVETNNTTVYVAFRPHLHEFMQAVAPLFEVVIFTASVSIYCNPLMDAVDPDGILGVLRLYREHCSILNGAYVKDLSLLGRDLDQVAIIDNSPVAYLFQQRNAVPITSWFDDSEDEELRRLIPMLESLAQAPNVYYVLDQYNAVLQLQQEQVRSESR